MRAAAVGLTLLIAAIPSGADLQQWEIPIVYGFLICDGPLEEGCNHFAESRFPDAFRAFQSLAHDGNHGAQNNLGVLFESGAGVPKSKEEALRWYRESASAGLPLAQHNLAVLIAADHILGTAESPSNRSEDFIEAYILFAQAASQGLEIASRGRSDLMEHMTSEEVAEAKARLRERSSEGPSE